MEILLISIILLVLLCIVLIFIFRPTSQSDGQNVLPRLDALQANLIKIENNLKEDFKTNREENATIAKDNRIELNNTIRDFKAELTQILANITRQNQQAWLQINQALEGKLELLNKKLEENNKASRESLVGSFKDFVLEQRNKFDELKQEQKELTQKTVEQLEKITSKVEEKLNALTVQDKMDSQLMREALVKTFEGFGMVFDKNVESFNNLQREKFGQLEERQSKMMESTEKKLEEMRATVDEKLQKTLNERLGQSFELVGRQLENVQKGLGEMQTLAQDVGGLKRVLSNVKMRGGIGEVQLAMLLEQVLAPEQYEANVRTKAGSSDLVEFAIKLPGRDDNNSVVWLPVDAKFPKDVYEQLLTAYDIGEIPAIETAQKLLDATIKRMAKDIRDKYIDPPNTTDFGIMFLPFEGIYAEVVRKAGLLDELQRVYKIVITGPTTLAAILNSLQMGFKTMAIQKRSGEVWQILGAVKREFELFGGMMEKAQNNIQTGLNQLDDVMGKRTRAIQRKLRSVETLGEAETKLILPEGAEDIIIENE
jgi:DNA recombination protein RmuC